MWYHVSPRQDDWRYNEVHKHTWYTNTAVALYSMQLVAQGARVEQADIDIATGDSRDEIVNFLKQNQVGTQLVQYLRTVVSYCFGS